MNYYILGDGIPPNVFIKMSPFDISSKVFESKRLKLTNAVFGRSPTSKVRREADRSSGIHNYNTRHAFPAKFGNSSRGGKYNKGNGNKCSNNF